MATLLATLSLALAAAPAAHAVVQPRSADAEAPLLTQFNNVNAAGGTLSIVDGGYGDAHSIRAAWGGGSSNGYARGIFDVAWQQGDDVWYSGAFFIPQGFKAAMQGQVAIMRWDDYGAHPEAAGQGGIVINGGDRRARLVLNQMPAATQTQLTSSFDLPEGRWFHLEVHQLLSSGGAVNEVFLDGVRVAASSTANVAPGRGADRLRFGIVAIASGAQTNPLSLQFDKARISTSRVGPDAALVNPPDAPTGDVTVTPPPPEPVSDTTQPVTTTTQPVTTTTTTTTTDGTRPSKPRKPRRVRYTKRVQKCVTAVLDRAERRGDVTRLQRAVRRCVKRQARLRLARR
jgi:hypothetical protein